VAIITNTSPVIALAKIRRLELVKKMYATLYLPPYVKVESVDKGRELGASDVAEIEKGISEGWIKPMELTLKECEAAERLVRKTKLGQGEAEAIVLAKAKGLKIVLDDKDARAIAKSWDLDYTSTVMIIYEAYVKKLISYEELIQALSELSKVMWISTDVITEVIKKAREVKE